MVHLIESKINLILKKLRTLNCNKLVKLSWLLYGPVEGKNNYIKKILSNANGMVNFKRARNRMLYSQNKYETYSTKEHKDKIKRPSNPRGTYKKNKK